MKKKHIQNSRSISTMDEASLQNFKHIFARNFSSADARMEHKQHSHKFGILTCIYKGITKVSTPNDSWIVSASTILYIPPDVVHTTEIMGECSALGVMIPNKLRKILPENIAILELTPLLLALFEKMASWELTLNYSPEQIRISSVAIDELKNAKSANHFHIPMPHDEKLKKMANEILKHPEDMSSIAYWAKYNGMSLRSFTRHFTEETGLSFTDWRQRVKVYTALKLLTTGYSVSDVALKLGYQNVSAFIAMFKNKIGQSPTEYLKNRFI